MVGFLGVALELAVQVLEQRGEIQFVFWAEGMSCARHARILPIDIEAIELISVEEVHHALDKDPAAVGGERDVGEVR